MTRTLLEYYDNVLARLEKLTANKEMVFNLLNIEDKETLEKLIQMNDKELINYLSD